MRNAITFFTCTAVTSSALFLASPGVAFAGLQCSPGNFSSRSDRHESVCINTSVSSGKLTAAQVSWYDGGAPVNDYKYEQSPAASKTGHFTIYGRGWSMDSPTRSFFHSSMDGTGGYNFDLADAPRPVQPGELICGRFFEQTPGGVHEWGYPACEKQ